MFVSASLRKRQQSVRECRTSLAVEMVAKRGTVVTFRLSFGLRVSKVSTVTSVGGPPGRRKQNCRRFWTCLWREERRQRRAREREREREERIQERRREKIGARTERG